MSAKAHPAFEVFQFEGMVRKHTGKFFDHGYGRTPGCIEFHEGQQWLRVGQRTAALLADPNRHVFGVMHRLTERTLGCFARGLY